MRLFVAVDFNECTDYFSSLQQKVVPADARKLDMFHLTLLFLGEIPDSRVEYVTYLLRSVRVRPFSTTFDHLGVFSIKRRQDIFWVGVCDPEPFSLLRSELLRVLPREYVKRTKRFIPHVTIARRKRSSENKPFFASRQDVPSRVCGVASFKLLQSTLTRDGPIYTVLETFPLDR